MCHIRMKIGFWCTFSSWSITLGICQYAFYGPLCHSPVFLMCHIRMKIGLWCTFSSWCVTSGRDLTASVGKKWVVEVEALYFGEAWLHVMSSSLDGMGEWFCNTLIHKVLAFSYGVKPPIRKLLAPDYQLLTISPSSVAVNQFDIFRGWDASDGMLKSRYCHQQSILKGEHITWNNRGKNW